MFNVVAMLTVIINHLHNLIKGMHNAIMGRHRNLPCFIQRISIAETFKIRIMRGMCAPLHTAQTMRIERQFTTSSYSWIFLPHGSCCSIARISKKCSPFTLISTVELFEIIEAHKNFAANFHQLRNIIGIACQGYWNIGNGTHISRNIFTGYAIASS